MSSNLASGKALLILQRVEHYSGDPSKFQFDVTAYVQTGGHDSINEEFDLITYDCLPAPSAAYKLKPYETVRVAVGYEFHYTQDYWGEHDVDLTYTKERVLRKQKAPRERYLSKAIRAKQQKVA